LLNQFMSLFMGKSFAFATALGVEQAGVPGRLPGPPGTPGGNYVRHFFHRRAVPEVDKVPRFFPEDDAPPHPFCGAPAIRLAVRTRLTDPGQLVGLLVRMAKHKLAGPARFHRRL
jgi:hypothetical protein